MKQVMWSTMALALLMWTAMGYNQTTKSVVIEGREWMAKNLDVSFFRNGDPIPEARTAEEWLAAGKAGQPAWCYYENDPRNGPLYGKLYNWHAVNDPRGLAPQGWHVASMEEWQALLAHFGGDDIAAGPLKAKGTRWWKSPNTGATDQSGLTILAGGMRDAKGIFTRLGYYATFWTASACGRLSAWGRHLSRGDTKVYHNCVGREMGFSVRCVRDELISHH